MRGIVTLIILVSLVMFAVVGCAIAPVQRRPGVDYFAFLDGSRSITEASKRLWLSRDLEDVLSGLGPNDRLVLYGVSDLTATAEPLFDGELPANQGSTMLHAQRYQGARARLVEQARARAAEFLTASEARQTDLLGAFDRLAARRPDVRGVVLFFSDMRHSTGGALDLERIVLRAGNIDQLAREAVQKKAWSGERLRGVEVRCHLDAVEPLTGPTTPARSATPVRSGHSKRPVNDREMLRTFWQALITSQGGTLSHFDNAKRIAPPAPASSATEPSGGPPGTAVALLQRLREAF